MTSMKTFLTDAGFSLDFIEEAVDFCTSGDEMDIELPEDELCGMYEEDRALLGLAPFKVQLELAQVA